MKNIKIFSTLLVLCAMACHPDEFPALGEREQILPKLAGTWSLSSVIQIDNDAVRKGFPDFAQRQDITHDFPYEEFKLVLGVNEEGAPADFTINAGDSPNIIGNISSGAWSVDSQDFPSKIIFGNNVASIQLGTTAHLGKGELVLKLIRTQPKGESVVDVVTYQYSFTKE